MKMTQVIITYTERHSSQRLDTCVYTEEDEALEIVDVIENALLNSGFHNKEDKDLIKAINMVVSCTHGGTK